MAQYPKMYRSGVQITAISRSGASLNDVNRSGYRVFHKHTSACYSAGHTHTDSCYNEVYCMGTYYLNADYKPECGSCHSVITDWDTTGHTLPEYPCYNVIDRQLVCGQTEGASTLICGYEV